MPKPNLILYITLTLKNEMKINCNKLHEMFLYKWYVVICKVVVQNLRNMNSGCVFHIVPMKQWILYEVYIQVVPIIYEINHKKKIIPETSFLKGIYTSILFFLCRYRHTLQENV